MVGCPRPPSPRLLLTALISDPIPTTLITDWRRGEVDHVVHVGGSRGGRPSHERLWRGIARTVFTTRIHLHNIKSTIEKATMAGGHTLPSCPMRMRSGKTRPPCGLEVTHRSPRACTQDTITKQKTCKEKWHYKIDIEIRHMCLINTSRPVKPPSCRAIILETS